MIAVLLTILKVIGIIAITLLGVLLLLLAVALFVPIRYTIIGRRRLEDEVPAVAVIKAYWLLHIFRLSFDYPKETFLRLKIFGLTVFRSDTPKKSKPKKKDTKKPKQQKKDLEQQEIVNSNNKLQSEPMEEQKEERRQQAEDRAKSKGKQDAGGKRKHKTFSVRSFFKKLWSGLKNIQYTIRKIYDKIKHIVKNIHYYIEILKSDVFRNAWTVNSRQILLLLKSVKPRKIKGEVVVGTGDPASTAQILAAYSMLYPFWGTHIAFIPDFERVIFEGEVLIKGRITLFRLLKTGATVYLNKDLRQLMNLLKREAE